MSIRFRETVDRGASHQEVLEYAVIDDIDSAAFRTFVVECIAAHELGTGIRFLSRVEINREKCRKYLLPNFFLERLAFIHIFLTMTFDSVAEDLMEEYAGCATG